MDTNFGTSPSELGNCDQQGNTVEIEPFCQLEIYDPPTHDSLKNNEGLQQIPLLRVTLNHYRLKQLLQKLTIQSQEFPRNPGNSQNQHTLKSLKTPKKNPETDAEETEETVITRESLHSFSESEMGDDIVPILL